VGWLELFSDLVFVAMVSQLTTFIEDGFQDVEERKFKVGFETITVWECVKHARGGAHTPRWSRH
jgi:low temperature requirement protein LtrA